MKSTFTKIVLTTLLLASVFSFNEHGYVYNYGDSDIIDVTGGNMAVRTQIISQKYEAIIR